jgi:hypothetical protein
MAKQHSIPDADLLETLSALRDAEKAIDKLRQERAAAEKKKPAKAARSTIAKAGDAGSARPVRVADPKPAKAHIQTRRPTSPKPTRAPGKPRAPRASSPVAVSDRPLGTIGQIYVLRQGKMYVHQFTRKASLFAVAGGRGLLVIRGAFKVDEQGFIHDER